MFDPQKGYKVAVVGSGISGISSAWFLSQKHDVTLFEKNPTLGGHTNTIDATLRTGETIPVDTGFIVYNGYTDLMVDGAPLPHQPDTIIRWLIDRPRS